MNRRKSTRIFVTWLLFAAMSLAVSGSAYGTDRTVAPAPSEAGPAAGSGPEALTGPKKNPGPKTTPGPKTETGPSDTPGPKTPPGPQQVPGPKTGPAHEETPGPEPAAETLARLDARIDRLALELNGAIWDCYLAYAEEGRIIPDIMEYPGLSYRALRDSVPAIDSLGKRLKAASDAYTEVLKSDPEYESVHKEYVALKGVKDRERTDANKGQYNLMYERLRKNNPDYEPARESRREAERQRNAAILRYLVDYHKSVQRVMPTEPLFRSYSDTMRALRARCPRIERLEEELKVLRKLRSEVFERLQRERFGVPEEGAGTMRHSETTPW